MRRPKIFFCHLPVFAVDVADDDESPASTIDLIGDGKLGYGFTSADDLEEVDIGPGDKPRPTFISKKLDPSLREPKIALLKEYQDCFTWDYTEMPGNAYMLEELDGLKFPVAVNGQHHKKYFPSMWEGE